jgi:hypothetical protein
MTVLTSESTLLGTTTGRLPRVNLMPPEVAQARAMRRVQMGLGAVGVGAVVGAAPGTAPVAFGGVLPIGTMTDTGVGFTHNDVALWLDAIAGLDKTYANPYFTNSTGALIGTRRTVNFNANAVVLSTAQSGRYKTAAGS